MLKLTKVFLTLSAFVAIAFTSSAAPVTAAPEPPLRAVPKVISIFSDAYTPVAGTNFNPVWGQATVASTINIATNPTLQYANLNYQGIEFYSDINAAGMTNLHLDVYTSDETSFKLYFIGRTAPTEKFVTLPLTLNTWNSIDIPMTDFTSQGMSLSDLRQFKFLGSGGKTVYIDNIYFFDSNATQDTEAPSAFTAVNGLITFSSIDLVLSATDNSNAVNFDITYGAKTITTGIASGKSKTITIKDLTPATAYNFSVVAKDGSGNVAVNSPIIVATSTTAAPVAAPTPTKSASKVISIFSDAYTNVSGTIFSPNWGQATVFSTIDIGGSSTIKYENLNYQGTEFAAPINAWAMDYMHVDVWTANETSLTITPLSAGKEKAIALTPLTMSGWSSFDIPLSSFAGVDMTALIQLKVVGSGGKTVYLDNIYFYNSSTTDDTEVPAAFTAIEGLTTFNTIDLVLSATDNSSKVNYEITYGAKTVNSYATSGVPKTITIKDLIPATAYNFSIVARDASGNVATNSPIAVSASTTAEPAAAPTPTVSASKVISIFSNEYTNVSGTIFNPAWQQATVYSLTSIGGSSAIKYDNLNYQGTEFAAPINASAMNFMHVDVWTANETSLTITPLSAGKEKAVALAPLTKSGWSSFDIPLSSFTGVNMSALIQLKVVGSGGKTVYLDNIYFYDNTGASLSENETENGIQLFPNPVTNTLNIVSEKEISEVFVSNILGQIVKCEAINSVLKPIDLSQLSAGQYFITIKQANGTVSTQKLIKQ